MTITIYHNPACGTSRNVLDIIRKSGAEPEVVDYCTSGWTCPQLATLLQAANLTPRAALRSKNSPAAALGLLDEATPDAAIFEAMLLHPILVNRPIVVSQNGTRLCRPSELVLDLLDRLPPGPLFKEDGEMILNEMGERVT